MTKKIGHGLNLPPVTAEKAEKQNRIENMRNSDEYKVMLKKNIAWLTDLDSADSNPNNGRVDISVFNAKVAKFGYEPKLELDFEYGKHCGSPRTKQDVDIQKQAEAMTDKYYSKQFGL